MQFKVIFKEKNNKKKIFYSQSDCSFYTEPSEEKIDYTLTINYLILNIVNQEVSDLQGYCPSNSWSEQKLIIPSFKTGSLCIKNHYDYGLSYSIADTWPIYINSVNGWLCIGDFESKDAVSVEFIKNCIASVKNNKLIALWLKPKII